MSSKVRMRVLATKCGCVAVLGLVGTAGINQATAAQTCVGTYAATALQPLPTQVVVGLDIHDRSVRNLKLADQFLAGLRDAGVSVGAQSNVFLHVSTSQLGQDMSQPSRGSERNYPELVGLQGGGQQPRLPALPATGLATPRSRPAPPLLFIRVDATEGTATRISWVASVQCQMVGTDEEQLAQELGKIIGSALGQRIERRPL